MTHLIIATRKSPLALWQAQWVKTRLEAIHSSLSVQLLGLTTSGDKIPAISLAAMGGKGLFVKELEEALLEGRADIAVHSIKDVPMNLPEKLCLPVICEREEARDVFISNQFASLKELPKDAVVGTSSLRRQSQLRALRTDIHLENLHGNIETRLSHLDRASYAAIILAAAGLMRLNLQHRIRSFFTIDQMLPAAGQGVLGIECRESDSITQELIAPLNHSTTHFCVTAERAMCRQLGGGCHVPVAAYATLKNNQLHLHGLVGRTDGTLILRAKHTGYLQQAELLGIHVAENLLQQGAGKILQFSAKPSS